MTSEHSRRTIGRERDDVVPVAARPHFHARRADRHSGYRDAYRRGGLRREQPLHVGRGNVSLDHVLLHDGGVTRAQLRGDTEALLQRGVQSETLTLHVGAGTFLPVKAEETEDHKMHAEWGRIDAATAERLNATRAKGGRLIAVGTTSLRLLESAVDEGGSIRPFEGDTAIFITPGYRFKAIDGLVTNFHLPRSTLFMLVSALMGLDTMKRAYAHAVGEKYRFYSYGDASFLLPQPTK